MANWNIAQLLLLMNVVQQLLAGAIWLLVASTRVAPPVPARHWAAASAWTALVMGLALAEPWLGEAYAHSIANMLAPGLVMLLRIGLELLYRVPRHDAEHLLVIVLALACGMGGLLFEAPQWWPIAYSSLLAAFVLWRCLQCIKEPLERELGKVSSPMVILPIRLLALLLALRAVAAMVVPEASGVPIYVVTPANVAAQAIFLTAGVVVHLSTAMAVALRLVAKLQSLAQRDPLTGLLNRRGLQEQWPRAGAGPVALLAVDVDHFKRINDSHGHAVGDVVLRHLAESMRRGLRSSDLAARIGGEEFVLVLPGMAPEQALECAERLRQSLEAQPVRTGGLQLQLTVSLGVAQQRPGDDADALIARADAALYAAKRAGRNRVMVQRP